jgi:uncharacterized protein YbjT (DUF2867 family)
VLLVTGATGHIGRDLVRDLDAKGARTRILVRNPARAADLPERVERRVGDLDVPETLIAAFAGVERLFLLTPGIGTAQAENAVAAASGAGVRHIVLLSSINVMGDPMPAMGRWHHEREQIVRASAIPATILRPGGFMLNALEWVTSIREDNFVLDPVGPGRFAPIDTRDIAAVAAAVLTQDGHADQIYALTGDETLTVTEQVAVISKAIGRTIEVRATTSPDEAVMSRFPAGAPQPLVDALVATIELMRADTNGYRTDTVKDLTGNNPTTFTDWCERNAAAFK